MSAVTVSVAALLGAAAGVLVPRTAYRLGVVAGTPARAGCEHCGRPFRAGPGGWLGPATCRGCRARLGPPTTFTVTVAGLAYGLLALRFGADPVLPALLAAVAIGLPLACVDLARLRLPDPLVATLALTTAAGLALAAAGSGTAAPLWRAGAAAVVCAGAYLLLALLPGSRLGFGDVKLAAVLGLPLGWLGWPAVLTGLLLPHLLIGPVALVLLLTRRAGRRTALPLGPAMLAGALAAFLLHRG